MITSSFVAVSIVFGLLIAGLGFASGVWFSGPHKSYSRNSSVKPCEPERDATIAADQTLMASGRVADLAKSVALDVQEHCSKVEAISVGLEGAHENSSDAKTSVLFAKEEIIRANAELQRQLERAELQIRTQAEQLRAREAEARTDTLTGLANRRAFDDELRKRFSEWERKQTPFSLLMLDIDHFKRFNDTHGHQMGDEVICRVAKVLLKQARGMDMPARYGGEEFAVILPATKGKDACIVAERIRKAIEFSSMRIQGNSFSITTSAGISDVAGVEGCSGLIKRADDALYKSKEAGRNCVHWHNGEEVVSLGTEMPKVPAKRPSSKSGRAWLTAASDIKGAMAPIVLASHRSKRPCSILCIKVEDCDTLVRRHGDFAVSRLFDQEVAPVMSAMRESDIIAQPIIDEVLVLFSDRTKAEATEIAKRLRLKNSNRSFRKDDGDLHARFSYEVCELLPQETALELISRVRSAVSSAQVRKLSQLAVSWGVTPGN
jgi:diguanylate cyclase